MTDHWNAVAAIGAVAVVILQAGAGLIWGGAVNEKIATLKKEVEPIAVLRAEMAAVIEAIDGLKDLLRNERPARRTRRAT